MNNVYYKNNKGILFKGNCLEILKRLPNESVDCIVTSPPYYRLRQYPDDSYTIWGGDKNCSHLWKECSYKRCGNNEGGNKNIYNEKINSFLRRDKILVAKVCEKCGAVFSQLGGEPELRMFINNMLEITAELKRVLKKTGVLFLNWGDSYGGNSSLVLSGRGNFGEKKEFVDIRNVPVKCMALQNYRCIIRMVDEQQWLLRNIIIWKKKNPLPESVKDRLSKTYEPIFFLTKSREYYFNLDAIRIPIKEGVMGRNPGDVWEITPSRIKEVHFATFPEELVKTLLLCGCPQHICTNCGFIRKPIIEKKYIPTRPGKNVFKNKSGNELDPNQNLHRSVLSKNRMKIEYHIKGLSKCDCDSEFESGVVLDPFVGSGTTAVVAEKLGLRWIGIEICGEYCKITKKRIQRVEKRLIK